MIDSRLMIDILKDQVTPAFGCTEPIAVALAVAKANETLGDTPQSVKIKVDKNIFKNALAVGIPGTDEKGLYFAVALAIVNGKSEYNLEVLKDVTEEDVTKAKSIVDNNIIRVEISEDAVGLYVEALVSGQNGKSRVVIKDKHDNIVLVEKNNKVVFEKQQAKSYEDTMRKKIKKLTIEDLKYFVDTADLNQLDFVANGIQMNKKMAEAGMGSRYSRVMSRGVPINNLNCMEYPKLLTASASYARMTGYPLPVMSCAGSGNHGIAATLPVAAVGEKMQIKQDKIIRAVTLSLLVTIYVKSYTGTLSPVCGCGVAAGVGASAGVVYLLDGDLEQIGGAIKNMAGTLDGIICDGGKPGCAFKLSISAGAAVESAMMAMNDVVISSHDGIVADTAEKTIKNLGKVSTIGMAKTDETILKLMLEKIY